MRQVGGLRRRESASSRAAETAVGSFTRTRMKRSGDVPSGTAAPGSLDQPAAPGSAIFHLAAAEDLDVGGQAGAGAAQAEQLRRRATNVRRRSMGQVSSSSTPTQPASHSRKSSGVSAGSR